MKVEFLKGETRLDFCCGEMEDHTLDQTIEAGEYRVCIQKLQEWDDGVYEIDLIPIKFCPFCGAKIQQTIGVPRPSKHDFHTVRSLGMPSRN